MNVETEEMRLRPAEVVFELPADEVLVARVIDRPAFAISSVLVDARTETTFGTHAGCDDEVRVDGRAPAEAGPAYDLTEVFVAHRPELFRIAYRILGSAADANDMTQEVWLRWQRQAVEEIHSPKAWLGSTTKRLCIDQLRSARRQREDSYGFLSPELLATAGAVEPDEFVDRHELLPMALGVMMRSLRPVERVVFLLRETFDYTYADIATIVGKDVANCRQIVRRAKVHLQPGVRSPESLDGSGQDLVNQFVSAAATGQVTGLLQLLNQDAGHEMKMISLSEEIPA